MKVEKTELITAGSGNLEINEKTLTEAGSAWKWKEPIVMMDSTEKIPLLEIHNLGVWIYPPASNAPNSSKIVVSYDLYSKGFYTDEGRGKPNSPTLIISFSNTKEGPTIHNHYPSDYSLDLRCDYNPTPLYFTGFVEAQVYQYANYAGPNWTKGSYYRCK